MVLCFCLSTLHHGGAERVVANICNELCKNNTVYIVLLSGQSTESIYDLNNNVHVLSLNKTYNKQFKRFHKIKPLVELFKQLNPDAVISFLPFVNVICHFACKLAKIVHITSERNDPRRDPKNIVLRLLKEYSMKKSNGLVCQTDEFKEYYLKRGVKNVTVIPNPVFIDACLKTPLAKDRDKKIVYAGRLERQKNVILLIRSFKNIQKKYCNYSLTIYGDGKDKKTLMKYVSHHNINNVEFAGPSKEWHRCVNNSRLFVLCSNYEGMPNSLLEALCLCVPCVSTNYGKAGPYFLINNGENGLICKKNSVDDLTHCIERLIESNDLCQQFSNKNAELHKKYDINIISKRWEAFILNTINSTSNK